MSRLRSDIWVAATLRRLGGELVPAVLRRRGAAEAGAIAVVLDRRDGTASLYLPAPPAYDDDPDPPPRVFTRAHEAPSVPLAEVEARLSRELRIDPDLWIVEAEVGDGDGGLDLAGRG